MSKKKIPAIAEESIQKVFQYIIDMIKSSATEGESSIILYDQPLSKRHLRELELLGYSAHQYSRVVKEGFFKSRREIVTSVRWE